MRIDVISIFPDYLQPLRLSLLGKAIVDGVIELNAHDLRAWTHDRHRTVDDTPYGGGAGMVMKPEPWGEALDWLLTDLAAAELPSSPSAAGFEPYSRSHLRQPSKRKPVLIFTSPSGEVFNQRIADELASEPQLAFACGRYEGIDRRVIEWASDPFDVREYSIGDFVLNGGEVAAMAMIEAIARLVPGVIGNPESLREESHSVGSQGLLEYPLYTKPASWRGLDVPEVLLSGHHARVADWRRQQSLELTRQRRPDLLGDS